jgi:hypothetical protein
MSDFIAQCMAPMGLCQLEAMHRIADREYDAVPYAPDRVNSEIMEQCLAEMAESAFRIGEWIG